MAQEVVEHGVSGTDTGEMMVFFTFKLKVALKKLSDGPDSAPEITVVGYDDIVEEVNMLLELSADRLFGKGCCWCYRRKESPDNDGV